jgi:hypothetical protein
LVDREDSNDGPPNVAQVTLHVDVLLSSSWVWFMSSCCCTLGKRAHRLGEGHGEVEVGEGW